MAVGWKKSEELIKKWSIIIILGILPTVNVNIMRPLVLLFYTVHPYSLKFDFKMAFAV